jgi:hypothetical protein
MPDKSLSKTFDHYKINESIANAASALKCWIIFNMDEISFKFTITSGFYKKSSFRSIGIGFEIFFLLVENIETVMRIERFL